MTDDKISICWTCKFCASCNKDCEYKTQASKLYKGIYYIIECSNYKRFIPKYVQITVDKLAEKAGINVRTMLRHLNKNEKSTIKELEMLLNLKVKIVRINEHRKYYIENKPKE